jgi:hypothetical protein
MVAESDELLDALDADTGRYFYCTGEVSQFNKNGSLVGRAI